MPVYHSRHNLPVSEVQDGFPLFEDKKKVIEEAILLFKPNSFYQSFDVQKQADIVLSYLHWFIFICLEELKEGMEKKDVLKRLTRLAVESVSKNPLTGRSTNKILQDYLIELRLLTAKEFCEKIYKHGELDYWWMCFKKRKGALCFGRLFSH